MGVRRKEGRRFSESELWYLLLAIVLAKCELDDNSHTLGDLQPGNIFLNAQQAVKVASLYSWPGQTTSYRRAILDEEPAYLAPEDVERLKLGAMDNKANSESEIFAIGMTLLSTALLQLNQDLYHIREREFNVNLFQQRLVLFQQDPAYS
jgi:serine/threonine protein kinase